MSWYVGQCGHPVPTTCRECERPAPEITDGQLAVLFRQAQWTLDDAAHDFPAGRATPQRREELAGTLGALAHVVRASALTAEPPAGRRLSALPAPGDRPASTPDADTRT